MSTHWATVWNAEFLPVIDQDRLLIACGFDGVIAPASQSIADAETFERTKILLRKISLFEGVTLAFASGRELPDLKSRLGMRGVSYCANNGMQIETPDLQWESAEARAYRRPLCTAMEELRQALAGVGRVRIDDRQFSLSVRCRDVPDEDEKKMEAIVETVANRHPLLRMIRGRDGWSLLPNLPINNGAALRFLLERSALEPHNLLILGAEDTDCSAFEVFSESLTIQINDAMNPRARFRANDASDVAELLFCLYVAMRGRRKPFSAESARRSRSGRDSTGRPRLPR